MVKSSEEATSKLNFFIAFPSFVRNIQLYIFILSQVYDWIYELPFYVYNVFQNNARDSVGLNRIRVKNF